MLDIAGAYIVFIIYYISGRRQLIQQQVGGSCVREVFDSLQQLIVFIYCTLCWRQHVQQLWEGSCVKGTYSNDSLQQLIYIYVYYLVEGSLSSSWGEVAAWEEVLGLEWMEVSHSLHRLKLSVNQLKDRYEWCDRLKSQRMWNVCSQYLPNYLIKYNIFNIIWQLYVQVSSC